MSASAAIQKVCILGSGTMGQGIAQVTASAGLTTRVYDAVPGRAEQAVGAIKAQLEKLVAKGKMDAAQRERALASLSVAADIPPACHDADLVIEAAPESMDLKVKLFGEVVAAAPALLRQMVRAGKLGKKSGEGFYVWKDGVAHAK